MAFAAEAAAPDRQEVKKATVKTAEVKTTFRPSERSAVHTLTNCNVWLAARSFYDPKGLGYLTTPYIESAMQRNACRLVL